MQIREPRPVIKWALHKRMVPEGLIRTVMALYEDAQTRVRCGSGYCGSFHLRVGVHMGLVLSPLLFATVVT